MYFFATQSTPGFVLEQHKIRVMYAQNLCVCVMHTLCVDHTQVLCISNTNPGKNTHDFVCA